MARKPTAPRGTPKYQDQRNAWAQDIATKAAHDDSEVTTREHRKEIGEVYEEHRVIKGRKVAE